MAIDQPQVKIPRAKLYKMISYKGSSGVRVPTGDKMTPLVAAKFVGDMSTDLNSGMRSIISGVNSLGATLNSLALVAEGMTYAVKSSVAEQVKGVEKIAKAEDKVKKQEDKRRKLEEDRKKKEASRKQRDQAEEDSEKGKSKLFNKIKDTFKEQTKKAFGGLFSGIAMLAKYFMKIFVSFAVLDWLAKNPEKVQKLAKGLYALGKFIFKITEFLTGSALDGLIRFLENPISLKGFFGAVQFVLSAAPIFVGIAFLKNPVATVKALSWVIMTLGKGILNMKNAAAFADKFRKFSGTKFGKVAFAAGAGISAAGMTAAAGGSTSEALGAGIGAGAGQAIGAALGEATGIPGAGAIAGAAGAMVGGAAGGAIGGFLEPIFAPLKKFFSMVGDVFNAVFAPIKDAFTGLFEALGDFMNQMLDAVEPHLPLIKNLLGFGVQAAFMPLFLGIKALTAVLRFFAPKATSQKKDKKEGKAAGGKVVIPSFTLPQAAGGGEIGAPSLFDTPVMDMAKMALGLREVMMLPFKAVGFGLVAAIGHIGNAFGAFLPAPLRSLMGAMLAPIAAAFGIPLSALGGGAIGKAGAADVGNTKTEENWEVKLLQAFVDPSKGIISLFGDLIGAVTSRALSNVAGGAVGLVKSAGNAVGGFFGGMVSGAKRLLGFSQGGVVQPEGFASGGWINGPMSGYPVSLDGGRSVSFIGHGTEWVGMKGFAGGGAFVVPFNTPATKGNPGLTTRRMREASRGGYAMPRFSMGGAVSPTLKGYANGGKVQFDPSAYVNGTNTTRGIQLGGKEYFVRYGTTGDQVIVKEISKKLTSGALGMGVGEVETLKPDSAEFKSIAATADLKKAVSEQKKGWVANGVTVDPKATLHYYYNKSYKDNYKTWKAQGANDDQAKQLAARAAVELAMVDKKGKASVLPGAKSDAAAPADLKNVEVARGDTPAASAEKSETVDSQQQALEKLLVQFGDAMKSTSSALTPSTPNASADKLNKAKLKEEEERKKKQQEAAAGGQVASTVTQAPPTIVGGGSSGAMADPITLPASYEFDADMYLLPKFGLVSEFNSDMVDLM
jgi:hypothetical protein